MKSKLSLFILVLVVALVGCNDPKKTTVIPKNKNLDKVPLGTVMSVNFFQPVNLDGRYSKQDIEEFEEIEEEITLFFKNNEDPNIAAKKAYEKLYNDPRIKSMDYTKHKDCLSFDLTSGIHSECHLTRKGIK